MVDANNTTVFPHNPGVRFHALTDNESHSRPGVSPHQTQQEVNRDRVYGLRLAKATKGHDRLWVEVQIMQDHVQTIDRPDGNTHDAHKSFRTKLNDIESETLDFLDKYPTTMVQPGFALQYQQLQD